MRPLIRTTGAPGACLAALLLVVPPAAATVTASAVGNFQALVNSDGAGDAITLDCSGGGIRYVEGAQTMLACSDTSQIVVNGNGGIDSIDLTPLQAADFPVLTTVRIDGGAGADNIKGSF